MLSVELDKLLGEDDIQFTLVFLCKRKVSNMSQIEFKDVSKVYPNGHVGLKNINLEIEKGEFAVIVGLSGAGKSTLLRSVNRLHDICLLYTSPSPRD